MVHYDEGSLWRRWDLHFHTPSSYDYKNKSVSNQQIVDGLLKNEIRVVAITDHHTMDVERIKGIRKCAEGQDLTVFPGIELRTDQGGEPIHYIALFPENSRVQDIWDELRVHLKINPQEMENRGGDDGFYVPIRDAAPIIRELGGVVSIHAGRKSNSIEEIPNTEKFQRCIKSDLVKDCVDLFEIGNLGDIATYKEIVFPKISQERPLVICSDNHDIADYSTRVALWLKADPTFRGLLMALHEHEERIYIGELPDSEKRIKESPSRFVRSVEFSRNNGDSEVESSRSNDDPENANWFQGRVVFNPGLVAIIGNKGSGKSALSDTLGLLGACRNASSFSFLTPKRFRKGRPSLARQFKAKLEWRYGDTVERSLADEVTLGDMERIKYLPQEHIERICTNLGADSGEGFESELKAVIFSHVDEASRLQKNSLDGLVSFRTQEKQTRIDTLFAQLKGKNRRRAELERKRVPAVRKELQAKLDQRIKDLAHHEQIKPGEVPNPILLPVENSAVQELSASIAQAEDERQQLQRQIESVGGNIGDIHRRLEIASKVLGQIDNLEKYVRETIDAIRENAREIGLDAENLFVLRVDRSQPEELAKKFTATIKESRAQLDDADPGSLKSRLGAKCAELDRLKAELDEPNRAYQSYLSALEKWKQERAAIEGNAQTPDSIEGLKAELAVVDNIPGDIELARCEQVKLALEILREKMAQVEVYRELYGPVQEFIESQEIEQNRLQLEFRAELADTNFASRFLALLSQNKKGSFYGTAEGKERVNEILQAANWEDESSVRDFLSRIDRALHCDERSPNAEVVFLVEQLAKDRLPEELFDVIYGLDYLKPRYSLLWGGKDISILSPGERGALLLVFYLLIDKGDIPLIIDQPEENLDNHTVAKVLVKCIRIAKRRRQVFIVTHNPNLAVVCDADQVVHASIDKKDGNRVTYITGALENPKMIEYVTDVLEGTRWAFDKRRDKYGIGAKEAAAN